MNIEEAREYCLSLKNVTECFPFDDVSLVFKVEGKMFLLLPLDAVEPCVSLKCSTDYVEDLRERYTAVEGAWHFNKKYWNTIYLDRGYAGQRDQALDPSFLSRGDRQITEENKRSLRK